jgi:16S rRNA (uracil1498-N3)-methyltransferase
VVPEIIEPVAFEELVKRGPLGSAFTFVEPGAARKVVRLASFAAIPPLEASIFLGPEGGWTADEIEEAAAVTHLVTLGRLTIRADAMALVALSVLLMMWNEF